MSVSASEPGGSLRRVSADRVGFTNVSLEAAFYSNSRSMIVGGQGSGIRDQGSGIRDQGSGIRDQGSEDVTGGFAAARMLGGA
ncbi:MAG: hypothetical protein LBI62_04085 [Candidatus Accumulibacter sp.]|nr:hypothetical protein [Accumulibacter sp.]